MLVSRYEDDFANMLAAEARQEFESLISRIPYIGGLKPWTRQLILTSLFLTIYRAMKSYGKTADKVWKIRSDMEEVFLYFLPRFVRNLMRNSAFTRKQLNQYRKQAAESQKRQYPGGDVFTIIEGDGGEFDYSMDITECAKYKFYRNQEVEEMSRTNRFFLRLAARSSWLIRKNMLFVASMVRRNPGKYIDRMRYKFSDPDKAAFARPEIYTAMIQNFVDALGKAEGGRAYGDDVVLHHALPWGFALEQIEVKVYLWQSENDTGIPNTHARYMAEKLPNCQATFIPNAGHLWHLDHMKEVLDTLVPRRS